VAGEAKLVRTDAGLVPEGDGWFVLNARDARWLHSDELGSFCGFEGQGEAQFDEVGINLSVLHPDQPSCMYHGEENQEDFLILSGECILIVEGEERPLKAWDFFHAPPWTDHVFVGAGSGPCHILSVGARRGRGLRYPVNETALTRGAGVERETNDGDEAYARFEQPQPGPFQEGHLPVLD
jgi:uncharacterized cupin superfamily protein